MRREVENLFMDYFTKMETSLTSEEGVYMNVGLLQLPKIYRMVAKALLTVHELNRIEKSNAPQNLGKKNL